MCQINESNLSGESQHKSDIFFERSLLCSSTNSCYISFKVSYYEKKQLLISIVNLPGLWFQTTKIKYLFYELQDYRILNNQLCPEKDKLYIVMFVKNSQLNGKKEGKFVTSDQAVIQYLKHIARKNQNQYDSNKILLVRILQDKRQTYFILTDSEINYIRENNPKLADNLGLQSNQNQNKESKMFKQEFYFKIAMFLFNVFQFKDTQEQLLASIIQRFKIIIQSLKEQYNINIKKENQKQEKKKSSLFSSKQKKNQVEPLGKIDQVSIKFYIDYLTATIFQIRPNIIIAKMFYQLDSYLNIVVQDKNLSQFFRDKFLEFINKMKQVYCWKSGKYYLQQNNQISSQSLSSSGFKQQFKQSQLYRIINHLHPSTLTNFTQIYACRSRFIFISQGSIYQRYYLKKRKKPKPLSNKYSYQQLFQVQSSQRYKQSRQNKTKINQYLFTYNWTQQNARQQSVVWCVLRLRKLLSSLYLLQQSNYQTRMIDLIRIIRSHSSIYPKFRIKQEDYQRIKKCAKEFIKFLFMFIINYEINTKIYDFIIQGFTLINSLLFKENQKKNKNKASIQYLETIQDFGIFAIAGIKYMNQQIILEKQIIKRNEVLVQSIRNYFNYQLKEIQFNQKQYYQSESSSESQIKFKDFHQGLNNQQPEQKIEELADKMDNENYQQFQLNMSHLTDIFKSSQNDEDQDQEELQEQKMKQFEQKYKNILENYSNQSLKESQEFFEKFFKCQRQKSLLSYLVKNEHERIKIKILISLQKLSIQIHNQNIQFKNQQKSYKIFSIATADKLKIKTKRVNSFNYIVNFQTAYFQSKIYQKDAIKSRLIQTTMQQIIKLFRFMYEIYLLRIYLNDQRYNCFIQNFQIFIKKYLMSKQKYYQFNFKQDQENQKQLNSDVNDPIKIQQVKNVSLETFGESVCEQILLTNFNNESQGRNSDNVYLYLFRYLSLSKRHLLYSNQFFLNKIFLKLLVLLMTNQQKIQVPMISPLQKIYNIIDNVYVKKCVKSKQINKKKISRIFQIIIQLCQILDYTFDIGDSKMIEKLCFILNIFNLNIEQKECEHLKVINGVRLLIFELVKQYKNIIIPQHSFIVQLVNRYELIQKQLIFTRPTQYKTVQNSIQMLDQEEERFLLVLNKFLITRFFILRNENYEKEIEAHSGYQQLVKNILNQFTVLLRLVRQKDKLKFKTYSVTSGYQNNNQSRISKDQLIQLSIINPPNNSLSDENSDSNEKQLFNSLLKYQSFDLQSNNESIKIKNQQNNAQNTLEPNFNIPFYHRNSINRFLRVFHTNNIIITQYPNNKSIAIKQIKIINDIHTIILDFLSIIQRSIHIQPNHTFLAVHHKKISNLLNLWGKASEKYSKGELVNSYEQHKKIKITNHPSYKPAHLNNNNEEVFRKQNYIFQKVSKIAYLKRLSMMMRKRFKFYQEMGRNVMLLQLYNKSTNQISTKKKIINKQTIEDKQKNKFEESLSSNLKKVRSPKKGLKFISQQLLQDPNNIKLY